MNQNNLHVVNMTDDEKRKMYGRRKKEELIEMIIARDRADELVYGVSGGTTIPQYKPLEKTTFSATMKNVAFDDDREIRGFLNEHFDELYEIEDK